MNESRPVAAAESKGAEDTGIDRDMELIWMDLREKGRPQGAYCQDYQTFKRLYRFVERGLMRVPSSAYTVLLTLVDDKKEYVTLQDQEHLMTGLGEAIRRSLRSGDVYTQYSSCQFLLMVMGTMMIPFQVITPVAVSTMFAPSTGKLHSPIQRSNTARPVSTS